MNAYGKDGIDAARRQIKIWRKNKNVNNKVVTRFCIRDNGVDSIYERINESEFKGLTITGNTLVDFMTATRTIVCL